MPIRKVDIIDADFADSSELASDGYSSYLTTTVVSTNSGTKIVTVNLPSDGEGLITGLDHPVEAGDRIRLTGTSGGADGYYTINAVLTDTTFSVVESISTSTGGTAHFIYPSGASKLGFDNTGVTLTSAKNVQDALKDVAVSVVAIGGAIVEIEVDFGSIPTRTKVFTVVDAAVSISSHIIAVQSGNAPTGKSADEVEMDPITFAALPGSGSFKLIASTLMGPVVGKFKVNYKIS